MLQGPSTLCCITHCHGWVSLCCALHICPRRQMIHLVAHACPSPPFIPGDCHGPDMPLTAMAAAPTPPQGLERQHFHISRLWAPVPQHTAGGYYTYSWYLQYWRKHLLRRQNTQRVPLALTAHSWGCLQGCAWGGGGEMYQHHCTAYET